MTGHTRCVEHLTLQGSKQAYIKRAYIEEGRLGRGLQRLGSHLSKSDHPLTQPIGDTEFQLSDLLLNATQYDLNVGTAAWSDDLGEYGVVAFVRKASYTNRIVLGPAR